jgi:rare lipoprotein A (peptidoglycan hydrolase)
MRLIMKRKYLGVVAATILAVTIPIKSTTTAQKPAETLHYEPEVFQPVVVQDSPEEPRLRRIPIIPEPTPEPTPKPTPKIVIAKTYKQVVTGIATWYNVGEGYYAAAGAALRVGDWRGRIIQVCTDSNCLKVKIIDWCACGNGRIVDLSPNAFSALYPLSKGVGNVVVKW